jgi:hypothetical protein
VGTYPCSNCGARADTITGCPECGRSVEQEITELTRVITKMQFRNKGMVEARQVLLKRIQGAIATRSLLIQATEQEAAAQGGSRRFRVKSPPPVGFGGARPVVPAPRSPVPTMPVKPGKAIPLDRLDGGGNGGPPQPTEPVHAHGPEVSSLSMQNVLLWLGALLFALAGTAYLLRTLAGTGRVAVFTVFAAAILAGAIPVAQRMLMSTAETIASVGLLYVLLDGFAIRSAWFAHTAIPRTTFAGLIFLGTAGVAASYRKLTHLKAPRFATMLLLQPVIPLLAGSVLHGAVAWAGVLAAVGLQDLLMALVLRGRPNGTGYLEDAAWILHGTAVVASLVFATVALAGAHTVNAALSGAAALILAGTVGLDGGLILRRWMSADVGAGLFTVALIGATGRLAAVVFPGRGLVTTALVILLVAIGVRYLPPAARRGPQLAGALAAGTTGVIVLARASDGIVASIRTATPFWHADTGRYADRVGAAAGPDSWQLALAALVITVAVVVALHGEARADGAVIGTTLTLVLVPATLRLTWVAVPAVLVAGAVALGVSGLAAKTERAAWLRVGAAALLGGYATVVSLGRPSAAAITLTCIAVAGVLIGVAPWLDFASGGRPTEVVTEAALGGAALALPGAVSFATAALAPESHLPGPILAAGSLAVAGTLGAAALARVARAATTPLPTLGAALGAVIVSLTAFFTPHVQFADLGVAVLLLVGAVLLVAAPWVDASRQPTARLDGSDLAAMAVTTAAIAAVARVAALLVPRYPLATAAAVVLAVALGVRGLPMGLRRGPTVGATLVGGVIAAVAGIAAVIGGLNALRANHKVWHADLATWNAHVPGGPGPQIPVALLLLAIAAAVVLAPPASQAVSVILVGLAALAVPAAFALPWWSPIAVSGLVSTVAGIAAARSDEPTVAWARAAVATVLFADTVGASLVRPDVTATTLLMSAVIYATVAATAIRKYRDVEADHLVQIGGNALAGAMLTLSAAAACGSAALQQPRAMVLTAGLAGLCLALAVVAVTTDNEIFLPFATGGVAIGGTTIAIATLNTELPVSVYAAAAALLVVIAELLRAAVTERRANRAGARLRPRPVAGSVRYLRARRLPRRQGYLLLLAAGPATVLAALELAPSVIAALIGPYRWVNHIWETQPKDSLSTLGGLAAWVGDGNQVLAAIVLTLAAALGAVGFGGRPGAVQARAVAVVIPGISITLLIAPYALRAPWPDGPVAAVAVGVLCGLGVALTQAPPDNLAAEPLRAARRIVVAICIAGGAAGLAGSLATKPATVTALAATALAGLVAAVFGVTQPARIAGWLISASAGNLLALVAGSLLGLPVYASAFLVGMVAGSQLVVAALLPQLRRPEAVSETLTVEASAYAGAVLGLLLAARSVPHLAVFTCAWGAVLGVAATKPGRPVLYRRALMWLGVTHEVVAWWLLMHLGGVTVPEAYTLAIAAVALITGYVEVRRHPDLSSWTAYAAALLAGFLPSLAIVLYTGQTPARRALLIVFAAATVAGGAWRRQQAPVVIGSSVLIVAALHELAVLSTAAVLWTVMALVGALLISLGANFEKRRRDIMRLIAWRPSRRPGP